MKLQQNGIFTVSVASDVRDLLSSHPSCSAETRLSQLKMYSFMGGGLFCAIVGNILLVVSAATDYWMQYRLSGNYAHQGLWRYCMSNKCYMQTDSIGEKTRRFFTAINLFRTSCFWYWLKAHAWHRNQRLLRIDIRFMQLNNKWNWIKGL